MNRVTWGGTHRRILQVILPVVSAGLLFAQAPSSASLEGVVVRYETEEPIAGATVELRTESDFAVGTTADRNGKFVIPNVKPGPYRLVATGPGYADTEYGQVSPGSSAKPFVVRVGERLTGLRVVMKPGGVITGRVVSRGNPSPSIHVTAGVLSYALDGRPVWKKLLSGVTNDLGEYSIFWLPPGRYYVMAEIWTAFPPLAFVKPGGGDEVSTSRPPKSFVSPITVFSKGLQPIGDTEIPMSTFFPRTTDWHEARAIEISAGAEIRNVDIDITPVPALHVRGTVTGLPLNPQGQPVQPQIELFALDSTSRLANVQGDPAGNFDLARVNRGSYLLRATAGNFSGSARVEIRDQDANGVTVGVSPGVPVSGRIVVERSDIPLEGLVVEFIDERGNRTQARPEADGSFTMVNRRYDERYRVFVSPITLPPGAGIVRNGTPRPVPSVFQNAYVKRITLGNVDVLNDGLLLTDSPNTALVITIGANAGSLEGRVSSGQQTVAGTTVVLIPESGQRFHVNHQFALTDEAGRFQINSVPPGDYKVFAWDSIEPGAWQNIDFVRAYESQGRLVHINEGEKKDLPALTPIP